MSIFYTSSPLPTLANFQHLQNTSNQFFPFYFEYTHETNTFSMKTLISKICYHLKNLLKYLMNIYIFVFKNDDIHSSYAFIKPTIPYIYNIGTSFRIVSFFLISQINRYYETSDLQCYQISIYVISLLSSILSFSNNWAK